MIEARSIAAIAFALAFALAGTPAAAEQDGPLPGTRVLHSGHAYADLVARLEQAVKDNQMGVVATASASRGAATRGVQVPGNAVIMVFRNDFAVRLLRASVPAGIEAPLRFYVTENADGSASLTYREPSAVFAPYGVPQLDGLAAELDAIFGKIAAQAVAP